MTLELGLTKYDLFSLMVESVNIYIDKLNLDIKGFKDYTYNCYYNKIPKKVDIKEINIDIKDDKFEELENFNSDNKKYVINYKNNCDIDLDDLYYYNKYAYIKYNLYEDVDYNYDENLGIQKLLTTPKDLFFELLDDHEWPETEFIAGTGFFDMEIKIDNFITYERYRVYYSRNMCGTTKEPIFTINYYDLENNLKKFVKDKRIKDKKPHVSNPYEYDSDDCNWG